jgi:hypothetical protein
MNHNDERAYWLRVEAARERLRALWARVGQVGHDPGVTVENVIEAYEEALKSDPDLALSHKHPLPKFKS